MDQKIYNLAYELHDELSKVEAVSQLNELDKKINDSYEVYQLANKKDEALENYVRFMDAYGEDHKETLEALKELRKAKEALNSHPLVDEYLKIYIEVRDIYLNVNNIVLSNLVVEGKETCR